jgi:hypothetical protein
MHIRKSYIPVAGARPDNPYSSEYEFSYWCGEKEIARVAGYLATTDNIAVDTLKKDVCLCCARAYGRYMLSLSSKKKDYLR